MFVRTIPWLVVCSACLFSFLGCGNSDSTSNSTPPRSVSETSEDPTNRSESNDSADHSHERGKMLIADAGPYHALLTAHLSPSGNELDIFFETTARNLQPVAIPLESFSAQATAGEGDNQTLKFEPAPASERPADEKQGRSSHFVARADWMKPEDNLLVVAKLMLDGQEVVVRWKDFVPQKYSHHVE